MEESTSTSQFKKENVSISTRFSLTFTRLICLLNLKFYVFYGIFILSNINHYECGNTK